MIPDSLCGCDSTRGPTCDMAMGNGAMRTSLGTGGNCLPIGGVGGNSIVHVRFSVPMHAIMTGNGITSSGNGITMRHKPLMCYTRTISGRGRPILHTIVTGGPTFSLMSGCDVRGARAGNTPTFSIGTVRASSRILSRTTSNAISIGGRGLALVPCCT